MSQTTATLSFDQSFTQRLARIDLARVMRHVQDDTGLADADIARAEDLYRKFLTLMHNRPELHLVPPRLIDEVWHAHITFTRQYMADCDLLFGRYIHHDLIDEKHADTWKAHHDHFAATQHAFEQEFGINLSTMLTAEEARITSCEK